MAVVTESFSIRDYAGRMRSVDIGRCWPFASRGDDAPPLPPISVRNFRWWADELDTARSAVLVEAEHRTGNGAAAAPADDIPRIPTEAAVAPPAAEEERRPSKGKQRTPKKRSILELFAAAPPIAVNELVEEDGDDEERRAEEAKGAGNGEGVAEEEEEKIKLAVVMRKKKVIKENNVKRKKRRKKRKGIKEGLKVEICAWEKEMICKPKMLSSVQSHMFQNPICSKKIKKTAMSFVERQKKPTKLKTIRKKHKFLQTSKLLTWNQEVPKKLPLRSILKNQKKSTTTKKSSKIASARAANLIKLYCESKRHVTFSVKDDMLGHSKACSSMNFPELHNLCKIFSDALAASSAINQSSKGHYLLNVNGRRQVVSASEKESRADVIEKTEASTSGKNHLSDSDVNVCQPTIVNSSNSSCSGTEKASFAVMVDLNHAIETSNDLDCFIPDTSTVSPSCIYSGDPTCRGSVHTKDLNSASEIHLEAGLPRASDASLQPKPHDKFVSSSDATSSLTVMKNPSSHSSTPCLVHNETNQMQYQPHVGGDVNFCCEREEHQSGSHSTTKGLLHSICYSMGSNRFGESVFTPDLVSTCKSKCICEDFIGLPLNSQGELIQFSSGTKFPEKSTRKNMELGSRHGSSAHKRVESSGPVNYLEIMKKKVVGAASHQKNQLDWRQKQHYSTRERVRHWLNFSELKGSERLEHQNNENLEDKDIFLHCNSNPTTGSFHEYMSHNVTHEFFDRVDLQGKCNVDYHVQPAVQPMMRLMGKNVVVGGINKECQGFDDGKTWRKETFSEQTQLPSMPEKPLSKQWLQSESITHATNGRSKGNLLERSNSSSNFCHMTAVESTFDYMSITQPQWLARNNVSSAIGNHTIKLDLNKHALPSHAFLNKTTQFLGNCISGEGSVTIGHHYPSIVASQPQNVHQHMLLSSIHCKHSQRVFCGTSTAMQPQFGYQNFRNHAHPPFIQPTAKLPQWLLHTNQQKRNQPSDSHYSNPTVISQPCGVSGTNLNSHLSPYHVPVVPFSVQKDDPRKACSSFAPNACTPAYVPVVTAAKSNAEFKNISIKKKERSGVHPKFSCFKGPVDAYKPKKRPADSDKGLLNPVKRPTLKRQADSNVPAGPRGIVQMNSYAILDKAISLDFQQTANGKGVCRNATGSSSSRFDSDSRPGPTKLIAGAKHILKPCQRMDDERCRSTHSTIILPNNAAVVKFPSSEKKIASIYKF